jgi:hypothetical protein
MCRLHPFYSAPRNKQSKAYVKLLTQAYFYTPRKPFDEQHSYVPFTSILQCAEKQTEQGVRQTADTGVFLYAEETV